MKHRNCPKVSKTSDLSFISPIAAARDPEPTVTRGQVQHTEHRRELSCLSTLLTQCLKLLLFTIMKLIISSAEILEFETEEIHRCISHIPY